MTRVQIIRTPGGERLAVLPVEDYEALVAAAADDLTPEEEEALAAEMRRLRTEDRGASLPAESFRRILGGENAVRVWREHRELTQAELAARIGVSAKTISDIENERIRGATETLRAIARELGAGAGEIVGRKEVEGGGASNLVEVVRVEPRGGYRLFFEFSDGTEGERDFSEMVSSEGPMIQPLKDPAYFARVFLDGGAPTWPNSFDLDPIALHHEMKAAGLLHKSAA